MNILFIHQNFPGQYKFLAPALAARGHRVEAMGISERPDMGSVKYHRYQTAKKNTPNIHPWVLDFETKVIRGEYCIRAASQLADSGFTPDVICAHPGWGESLFLKELWPLAKQLHYVEYFYNSEGQDMGFDQQFETPGLGQKCRLWTKNANNLMNLVQMDQGVSPTAWQHASIPEVFKEKIAIIHDGIDTRILNASDTAVLQTKDDQGRDVHLTRQDEVVTFVNRNLEPFRGYHIFMRSLPRLMRERPHAKFVVIGGDSVSYGAAPKEGTWKQMYLDEVKSDIDLSRLHFLGRVPYPIYVNAMQVSKAHIYLTYPFVLSWSLLECMAMKVPIIASATPPVMEVVKDGWNGHLVDFFDVDALVAKVVEVLDKPHQQVAVRENARQTIVEKYDLITKCLPAHIDLVESMVLRKEKKDASRKSI
jgi:glycosyltransferase involved in cell wall biosynthesis